MNTLTGFVMSAAQQMEAIATAATTAPLNPAYKEEEFKFFLEDTNARVLLLPPDGGDAARRAAGDSRRSAAVRRSRASQG